MIFYVIGNGFDIHYGLNTTYENFKIYLIETGHKELVDKVDELCERHFFTPQEIKTWSSFEDMLVVFNRLDPDELYDEAMNNAEQDDERAGYWDSPSWNVSYYNEYIHVLKQEFEVWIEGFDTNILPDYYFNPQSNDFILTFNYTTTIEDSFPYDNYDIIHIHGVVGHELALGHNEYQIPDTFVVIEDETSDYRDTTTKNAVNNVVEQAAIQYFKNSDEILHTYKNVFLNIPHYDKVVFMGLSCGRQDSIYVEEILKYAKEIDFYYYKDVDRINFESYIANSRTHVTYIKW